MTTTLVTPPEPSVDLQTSSIRRRFPALERKFAGKPVAYFDGPGGTQVPLEVAHAMKDYLLHHNANTHWAYPTSIETDAAILQSREAMADFLNCLPTEVVFGNNMTTITFHLARALGRQWGPDDEIVVTDLDHQANVSPWRALAQDRGVTIHSVPFNPKTGELVWDELARSVTRKTRLLAIGAASNALGTISPIREASQLAHDAGALCFVDAVHFAAHSLIDVQAVGCDFLVCSPYKFYGPHIGVLYARAEIMKDLEVPKVAPASNAIPERMETGTQNHEGIVGARAAVDFLASLAPGPNRRARLVASMNALHARGDILLTQLWEGLSRIDGVQCFGPPPGRPRTPTVSFAVDEVPSAKVAKLLAQDAIFASNGNFYASTVVEQLGYAAEGLMRAGCACYTTGEEVDRLVRGIQRIKKSS